MTSGAKMIAYLEEIAPEAVLHDVVAAGPCEHASAATGPHTGQRGAAAHADRRLQSVSSAHQTFQKPRLMLS